MKHGIVYHMALRLYSMIRHKDYRNAYALCLTLQEHLEQLLKEKDDGIKTGS